MTTTRPITEQLRFTSSLTGSHILDEYLEACEIGGKTLAELLDVIFDSNGEFDAAAFDFRLDPDTAELQFRIGTFTDPNAGWRDTGDTVLRTRGEWATSTEYRRLDLVTYNNNLYIATEAHTSGPFFDISKWMVAIDDTPLQAAVAAAQEAQAAAEAAVLASTGAVNIPADTWIGDGETQIFSPSITPSSAEACLVTVGNVVQEPGVAYNLVAGDIVFTAPPPNGAKIVHRYLGGTLNQMAVIDKNATFTLDDDDNFKVFRTTGTFTMNLPAAANAGNGYLFVVKVESGTVTLDPNGSETIDGISSKNVTSDVWCFCDGSGWFTLDTGTGGGGAVDSVFGRTGNVTAQAGDYTASQITNTPSGNISATTVQAAINELDTEKAAADHDHDSEYAPIGHNHDSAYASINHDHDSDYAPIAHNHDGVYQPIDGDLTAIAGLSSTGLVARTGSGAAAVRTITGGTLITVSNGNGVSGNPTVGLSNIASGSLIGRVSAGTGAPGALTAGTVTAMLDAFQGDFGIGGLKGLVPAPGAGDAAAGKFLKADGTWATPAGGGGGSASEITFSPAGNISSTNVQAAIQELDSEKAANNHGHFAWDIVFESDGLTFTDADDVQDAIENLDTAMTQLFRPFVIATMLDGKPAAGQEILRFTFPFTVHFPDGADGSFARAKVAPTSNALFTFQKNGSPISGGIFFEEEDTDGNIGFGEGVTFAAGDTLTVIAPSPQDATLADLNITLCAAGASPSGGGEP